MNKTYLVVRTKNYNAIVEHFDVLNENAFKHAAHSLKAPNDSGKINPFNNFSNARKYSTNSKIDNNYENSVVLDALATSTGFTSHAAYKQQLPVIQKFKTQNNLKKYVPALSGIATCSINFYELPFHELSGQTIFDISSAQTKYISRHTLDSGSENIQPIIRLLAEFHHLPSIGLIAYNESQCLDEAEKILEIIQSNNEDRFSLNDDTYTKVDIINYLYKELLLKLDMSSKNHISTYNFTTLHDSLRYNTLIPFINIQIRFIENNEYHHINDYSDYKIKTSQAILDTCTKILHVLYQEFIKQQAITIHTLKGNEHIVIFSKQNGEYCILVKDQISELLPREDRLTGLPFNELPYSMQEDYHYEYWKQFEHTKPICYEESPDYYQFRDSYSQYKVQYFNENDNDKKFHIEHKKYQPLRLPRNLRLLENLSNTTLTCQRIKNILFHKAIVFDKTLWVSELISHDDFAVFIDNNPNYLNERNSQADKLVIRSNNIRDVEIKDEFLHNHNPYREPVNPISVTWFDIVKYLKWFEECAFHPIRLLMASEFHELRIRGHKDTWLSKDEFIQLKSQEQNLNADDLSQHDQEYFHHQYRALKHDITKDGIRFHTDVDEAEWLGNFKLIRTKLMSEIWGTWSLAQRLANDPQHPILPDSFLNPPQEISTQNNGHDFGFKTYFRLCFEEPTN